VIDLYYFPTPNGWKVSIALEELGLPYRLQMVDIGRGEQFKPEFLRISPNNRIPAIVDHEPPDGGAPLSVFESGAILLYLAAKTGRLMPRDPRRAVAATEWLMWQMAGLGPMLGQLGHFRRYAPEKIDYALRRYGDEALRLYRVMDTRLQGRDYLADEYSMADIACFGWVALHEMHEIELGQFPQVQRWFRSIEGRPAVQRGRAAGRELMERAARQLLSDEARRHLFGQR
jgi:GST-like protein